MSTVFINMKNVITISETQSASPSSKMRQGQGSTIFLYPPNRVTSQINDNYRHHSKVITTPSRQQHRSHHKRRVMTLTAMVVLLAVSNTVLQSDASDVDGEYYIYISMLILTNLDLFKECYVAYYTVSSIPPPAVCIYIYYPIFATNHSTNWLRKRQDEVQFNSSYSAQCILWLHVRIALFIKYSPTDIY